MEEGHQCPTEEELGGESYQLYYKYSQKAVRAAALCRCLKMETQDREVLCFPHLPNISCRKPASSLSEFLLLRVLLTFISVITVVLNLLVIISVSHFRQLHTPTNILLLSLAVSDFLIGLLLMPAEIFLTTNCWSFGDVLCSLYFYMLFIITSASTGHMMLISVDRYVAICYSLHYPTSVTERRVKICACLYWLYCVFYGGFSLRDNLTQPGKYNSCYGECMIFIDYITGKVDLVISFIIPITVIVVLYMRIFVVAVSQARAMRSHIAVVTHQHSVTLTARRSELKAARTLGVLVVVYLICFCPFYCISFAGDVILDTPSAYFAYYLFYFNSCINPVIYALFYPWFRKAAKLIVTLQILQTGSNEAKIL